MSGRAGRRAPETGRRPAPWSGWGAALPLPLLLLAGCADPGHLELTALDYQMIDPPAPQVTRIGLDRAYWWTDDQGDVWISLERVVTPLFGKFGTFRFQFSFAVDKPPAGKARNYILAQREFRGLLRLGPAESRLVSVTGILALFREPGDRFRGSFRLEATRQTSRMLGGFGPAVRYLLLGRFNAVLDAGRGAEIAAATESNGWERGSRATTRPARRTPVWRSPMTATAPTTQPAAVGP